MARSLLILGLGLAVQNPSFSPNNIPINFFFLILAVLSVFSITTFLCASNKNKGFQRQKNNSNEEISILSSERKLVSKINSNLGLGSKAQLMVEKMICWRKVEAEEEEEEESDEAVWRKTIMMGERCRPLEFSGKILYDCEGNLVPAADHSTQGDHHI